MKIPIHKGPIERNMIAGLPRNVAILGGTMGSALVLGLQNLWMVIALMPIYITLIILYRLDSYFLEILIAHVNENDFLVP